MLAACNYEYPKSNAQPKIREDSQIVTQADTLANNRIMFLVSNEEQFKKLQVITKMLCLYGADTVEFIYL
jgi:hypothetical protein